MAQYTDCQIKDSVGRNALHYAAVYENYALAEYLLNELGFDPNERDVNGKTPAELAYERGYTELAELIDNKSQP
jgi:ankyrin repeat protein